MASLDRSLSLKVALLIAGILIAAFTVLFFANLRREEQLRVEKYRETARLLATSMMTSIENGMIEGRPDIIRRLVQEMKTELKEVRALGVYRRNGVEAFTDLKTVEEVDFAHGLDPDMVARIARMKRDPGSRIDHPLFRRAVETVEPQETYESTPNGRWLTVFQPLRNLSDCQGCHGSEDRVRGIMRVSLGLDRLDAELAAERTRRIIIALVTIVILSTALIAFLGRVVLRPVAQVAAAARRIGAGEFDSLVRVRSRDEIGQLGEAINEMSARLKQAYEQLEAKNRELDEALKTLRDSMKRVELLEQLKGELSKFVPESVQRLLERNPNATELEKSERDVSVLFLDIAGYTRLSEQMDPKQLNRLVQRYFSSFLEIIHDHHGEVNETAGDGLMVIFQSDRSQVEHALNATRSALAIHRRVDELNEEFAGVFQPVFLHVGINSGTALVGATKLSSPSGERWTFTATGPVTNVAARVAGQAGGGEILVSGATADRIRDHFVLENLGERALKNVAEPVRLFRLVPPGVYDRVARSGDSIA
ncbi:MAG TPA: adenylate/guanylate cyclase domain-containing protein [candidate division Zixibacteria bacterium]|nr:adenylate/guanylate cyclase domain-containing protein [candidate division Zixibacteria bacterium]